MLAMVTGDATQSALQRQTRDERRLWLLSAVLALLLTVMIMSLMGVGATIEWTFHALRKAELRRERLATSPSETEVLVVMGQAQPTAMKPAAEVTAPHEQAPLPEAATSAAKAEEKPALPDAGLLLKKRFARTSADQEVAHAVSSPIVGERNADAVSDAAPVAGAPALLPSQAGVDPLRADDVESVESRYQDGRLDRAGASALTAAADTAAATAAAKVSAIENKETPRPTAASPATALHQSAPSSSDPATAPAPETAMPPQPAMTGDVPVPRPLTPTEQQAPPKPAASASNAPTQSAEAPNTTSDAARPLAEKSLPKPREKVTESSRPMSDDPAFNGNQKKTRILGSVSRTGTSSQQVAATPLGKYQAQLSRVIESEWHRNCVKYRDFIKPGILTLRFVIDDLGAVRSVMLVEMVEAGDVQKGFTMNTIRQAKIPPLPADVKKELNGEALELIYNFYF